MSRKVWCKHYRGMHEAKECEAGVRFDSLPHHGTKKFFATCPCFGERGGCDKAEYPTPEEVARHELEQEKRFQAVVKARVAIVDALGGPWQPGQSGSQGVIDCPVCDSEKSLHFTRSRYNGHIHAACETDGCVRWMK